MNKTKPQSQRHVGAHVYVLYWPEHHVTKVGITVRQQRWQRWERLGAALIATNDYCCINHARTVERWMLAHCRNVGVPAFTTASAATSVLGHNTGGFTECYRWAPSPRFGQQPDSPYDYEAAYGLMVPPAIRSLFDSHRFALMPTHERWDRRAS